MTYTDLKEIYFYELNRIYNFNEGLTFPVSLLVVLGGALVATLKVYFNTPKPELIFTVFISAGSIFLVLAFISLCCSILPKMEYKSTPSFTDLFHYKKALDNYDNELQDYNKQTGSNIDKGESYDEYLTRILSECIDHNSNVNLKRTRWLSKSLLFLAGCAVCLAASSISYFKALNDQPSKPLVVKVLEEDEALPPWR
ncbi:hypothetical protein ACXHP8_08625 [Vibrio antiquarius]